MRCVNILIDKVNLSIIVFKFSLLCPRNHHRLWIKHQLLPRLLLLWIWIGLIFFDFLPPSFLTLLWFLILTHLVIGHLSLQPNLSGIAFFCQVLKHFTLVNDWVLFRLWCLFTHQETRFIWSPHWSLLFIFRNFRLAAGTNLWLGVQHRFRNGWLLSIENQVLLNLYWMLFGVLFAAIQAILHDQHVLYRLARILDKDCILSG